MDENEPARILPSFAIPVGMLVIRARPARGRARLELEARQVTIAVFAALKEQLSLGEADDIVGQLPKDLKRVWEGA